MARGRRGNGEPCVGSPLAANARILLTDRAQALKRRLRAARRRLSDDAVHDLRVASRRLRECLSVLRRIVGGAGYRKPGRAARRLTRMLGEPRNLDVAHAILGRVIAATPDALESRAAQRYRRRLAPLRREGRVCLKAGLRRYDHGALAKGIRNLCRSLRRRRATCLEPEMIEAALRPRLDVAFGLKRRALVAGNVRAQHRLRIALKKTRYCLEVLSFAFTEKGLRVLKTLEGFQDLLGRLHDLDVLLADLRAWGKEQAVAGAAGRAKAVGEPGRDRRAAFAENLCALARRLVRERAAQHRLFMRRLWPLQRRRILAELLRNLKT